MERFEMTVISVIGRVLLVCLLSITLALLAKFVAKIIGIDIKDIKQRTNPKFLLLAVVFNLLFILAIAIILKFVDSKNMSVLHFGLDKAGVLFSFAVILINFLLAFGCIWILHMKDIVSVRWVSHYLVNTKDSLLKILGFSVLFITALQEEVMFRGYLNTVLSIYGVIGAIIWSSIIFTVFHFITNKVSLFQAIDWFLGGIMLFYVYLISGSIWVATIVHFSRNFANVLVLNIANGNSLIIFDKPIRPLHKTIYTITLSAVIIIFTYMYYGNTAL